MNKFKVIFNQTLMISTAILFGLSIQAIICYLLHGTDTVIWDWYTPISLILSGFFCALPTLFLLSSEDISGKKFRIRIVLHFISVWAVLSLIGYIFDWFTSGPGYGIIMIMYVIIYCFVWLCTWWMYTKEDKAINEKIKDIQDEE